MSDKPLDIQFQKRFVPNLVSNIICFIVNIIIGLLLVPFFIDTLGESAYSLVPLATSLTSYVVMIIDGLNSSISRYLTVSLQRGDVKESNNIYNTSIFATLALVLLLLPVSVIIAYFIPSFIDIGTESATSVFILFALVFGSVLVRSWSSNFMSVLFAHNRLDLRNWVNAANVSVQFILILVLFVLFEPTLELVGFSYLVAALVALVTAYCFSRKVSPELKISLSSFTPELIKEIGRLSLWVIFNTVGSLLCTHVALLLANMLCGTQAGAEYAIAQTWFTLLYAIGGLVSNIFTPKIYSYYSAGDIAGLVNFTKFTTKVVGIFIALPVGLVCIFASELLGLWVGEEYEYLVLLLCIIVLPVIIQIQASCSYAVYVSTKKIQIPAISCFLSGGITIGLSILLASVFDLGVYGIAIAVGFSLVSRQGVFNPIYTAHVLKASKTTYFKPMYEPVVVLACLLLLGALYDFLIPVDSVFMLIVSGLVISLLYVAVVLKICFRKNEKELIKKCLPGFILKVIPSQLL